MPEGMRSLGSLRVSWFVMAEQERGTRAAGEEQCQGAARRWRALTPTGRRTQGAYLNHTPKGLN